MSEDSLAEVASAEVLAAAAGEADFLAAEDLSAAAEPREAGECATAFYTRGARAHRWHSIAVDVPDSPPAGVPVADPRR